MTKSIFPPGAFVVEKLILTTCQTDEGNVEFSCKSVQPFDVVKDKLKVKEGQLSLNFNYKELQKGFNFKNFGINISGKVTLGTQELSLVLKKTMKSAESKFQLSATQIKPADIVNVFSKDSPQKRDEISNDKENGDGKEKDLVKEGGMFSSMVIESPAINGVRSEDMSYEIVGKGKATGIKGINDITGFFIVQKPAEAATGVGVVVSVKKIEPMKILSLITGKELDNIPIIKEVTLDLSVEYATKTMDTLKNEELQTALKEILTRGELEKGAAININFPTKEILQKIGTPANLDNIPENMAVLIVITEEKIMVKFSEDAFNDGMNILAALVPKAATMLNKYVFKEKFKVIIKKYDVNVKTKEVEIAISIPDEVVLGVSFFKVKNAYFEVKHDVSGKFEFKLEAEMQLVGASAKISIEKMGSKFEIKGSIESLTSVQLLESFGSKNLANEAESTSKKFNFGIRSINMTGVFGEGVSQEFRVVGVPILFSWEGLKFEAVMMKKAIASGQKKQEVIQIKPNNIHPKQYIDNVYNNVGLESQKPEYFNQTDDETNAGEEGHEGEEVEEGEEGHENEDYNNENSEQEDYEGPPDDSVARKRSMGYEPSDMEETHVKNFEEDNQMYYGNQNARIYRGIYSLIKEAKNRKLLVDENSVKRDGDVDKNFNKRQLALAIVMNKIKVDEIIKFFTEKEYSGTNWMTDLDIALVISNTDEDIFTMAEVKKVVGTPNAGVYFTGKLSIPKDCKKNPLCELAKSKMNNDAKLFVTAGYKSGQFFLKAGYDGGNFEIGKKFSLNEVFFELKVGVETSFSMNGKFTLSLGMDKLVFEASLGVTGTAGISFSAKMTGMWNKAFGSKYLAIGNMALSATLQPPTFVPTEFCMQGQINFGIPDKAIIVKGAGGFSVMNPLENYIYGSICKLTLEALATAFGYNPKLPQAVLDTGFPDGLVVSLSASKKEIKSLDLSVKTGLNVQGTINVLGYKVKSDISVAPTSLLVDVELAPINWFKGAFVLSMSMKDQTRGPKVYIKISPTEVKFQIKASVSILGISTEVSIAVGDGGIEFEVNGDLFGIFKVSLQVRAPYGKSLELNKEGFRVSACISAEVTKASEAAIDLVKEGAKEGENVSKEKDQMEKTQATWYDSLIDRISAYNQTLYETQKKMSLTAIKIEKYENKIETCSQECNEKSWLEKQVCKANCKMKGLYYEIKVDIKKVKQKYRLAKQSLLIKLVEIATDLVEKAKVLIDTFQRSVEVINDVAKAGLKAAQDLANYVKKNFLEIHYACFNTTLSKASGACFGVSLNVTLMGKKTYDFESDFCFNGIAIFKSIGSFIANKVYPGISTVNDKVRETQEKYKATQEENKKIDDKEAETRKELDDTIKDLENDSNKDDDEDDSNDKRGFIYRNWTREECFGQLYREVPAVSLLDTDAVEALDVSLDYSLEHHLEEREDIPIDIASITRDLSKQSNKCELTKILVKKYQMISDHVVSVFDELDTKKKQLQAEAVTLLPEVRSLGTRELKKCVESGCTSEQIDKIKEWSRLFKEAHNTRVKNLQFDFKQLESRMVHRTGVSFVHQLERSEVDVETFIERLRGATQTAARGDIQHSENVGHKLNEAFKLIRNLLVAEDGGVNKDVLQSMRDDMTYLRNNVPCAA